MLGCLIMVVVGFYYAIIANKDFVAGSILMFIGAIAMLIIGKSHKHRRKEWKRTFMDW